MSQSAEFRDRVERTDRFLETCEGGDAGSPTAPSVWLFGLEPGWGKANQRDDELDGAAGERHQAEVAKYSVELQLTWPYNRAAFQIMSAIEGYDVADFDAFALKARPFERGAKGYFKGNLFPEPFQKIKSWDEDTKLRTGFDTKEKYREWLRAARFPVVQSWLDKCRPKLLLAVGISNLNDFMLITASHGEPEEHVFEVNGHRKRMFTANSGNVPLAVLPHISNGSHGLNSYRSREIAAEIIRTKLLNLS